MWQEYVMESTNTAKCFFLLNAIRQDDNVHYFLHRFLFCGGVEGEGGAGEECKVMVV